MARAARPAIPLLIFLVLAASPAVALRITLAEAEPSRLLHDGIEIPARGEEIHPAVSHDPHDQERRLGAHAALTLSQDRGLPDHVAVRLALVDVRLAQGGHAVAQHALGVGVHEPTGQPLPVIVG